MGYLGATLLGMIADETVLILGAGASKPYGFPTGNELRKHILYELLGLDELAAAENGDSSDAITRILDHHSVDELRKFRERFYYSSHCSIDFFLREHLDFDSRQLGKRVIAASLIGMERDEKIFSMQDWYQYLYNNFMLSEAGIDTFTKNKLSIVTFNYDRSLEHFFFKALENGFNKPTDFAVSALSSIPVLHVHGSLGNYCHSNTPNSPQYRHYSPDMSKKSFDAASEMIQIFSEKWNVEALHRPIDYLKRAKRIGFLGFGYEETNLMKLFCEESDWFANAKRVSGTTLGLPASESSRLKRDFQSRGVQFEPFEGDCLSFLKDTDFLAPL